MDFIKFYSEEKWKGLTNITNMHNLISTYSCAILAGAKFLPRWLLETNIKGERFNLFGQEYAFEELEIPEGVTVNKQYALLGLSHIADLFDSGIVERRMNHANVFGIEWVMNFRQKHEMIVKDIYEGKDLESILLETAWNAHYLQDALSPMHTHPYFQERHIEFENYVSENFNKLFKVEDLLYYVNRNLVLVNDIDSLIAWVRSFRQRVGYNGLRAVMDYLNQKYNFGYKVLEHSFRHGVIFNFALSTIATINYYLIVLDYIR